MLTLTEKRKIIGLGLYIHLQNTTTFSGSSQCHLFVTAMTVFISGYKILRRSNYFSMFPHFVFHCQYSATFRTITMTESRCLDHRPVVTSVSCSLMCALCTCIITTKHNNHRRTQKFLSFTVIHYIATTKELQK